MLQETNVRNCLNCPLYDSYEEFCQHPAAPPLWIGSYERDTQPS